VHCASPPGPPRYVYDILPYDVELYTVLTDHVYYIVHMLGCKTLAVSLKLRVKMVLFISWQVKVSAQVTRYKDYESLYRDMKKQLKEFQTSGGGAAAGNPIAGTCWCTFPCIDFLRVCNSSLMLDTDATSVLLLIICCPRSSFYIFLYVRSC